jgi:TPR repeat protein
MSRTGIALDDLSRGKNEGVRLLSAQRDLTLIVLCGPLLAVAAGGPQERCLTGEVAACAEAAEVLFPADGGPGDAPRAVTLLEKGCEGGVAIACTRGGRMVLLGQGLPKDPARGVGFLERGCSGADARGCRILAP